MGFTPQQAQCISTLDRPLAVTAGAGSGKTFTLTQRIVHALESGYIQDIGQLLAITYTEKAAGELKTRICRELRAHGMVEQALKANDAWISTIHGMCSRILREHAIELGIDPGFSIIPAALLNRILEDAVNDTLQEALESDDREVVSFLREYPAEASMNGPLSTKDLIIAMGKALEKQHCGFTLAQGPEPMSRGAILSELAYLAETLRASASLQKESASQAKAVDTAQKALDEALPLVESGSFGNLSPKEFLALVELFPVTGFSNFGSAEHKALAKECIQQVKQCMMEARLLEGRAHSNALLKLGRRAWDKVQQQKQQLGYLSNDDLLMLTYQAMETQPQIADCYRDRFKLVMVDEFQDTNQMQVDMISKLAGSKGQRLAVVGDAQQSIYRFQGADVSVYKRHLGAVREDPNGRVVTLPDNFRSHRDVLALVDAIFGLPEAFGGEFMHLDPKRDESRSNPAYDKLPTRVEIQRSVKPASKDQPTESLDQCQARQLANRFKELHQQGYSLGDMVILMGSTSQASIYAQALQDLDLPCVVVKGSVFNWAPEVNLMVDAAFALMNPNDSEHLYRVLCSPLFNLSAQDFLTLATGKDAEGNPRKRSLWKGICTVAYGNDGDSVSSGCFQAATIVARSCSRARSHSLSDTLLALVNESGMLLRLHNKGAEGRAQAANILKALRVLDNLEATELTGGSQLAFRYEAEIASLTEAPGALSAEGGEFVRILTIHSSKGLEFPIVAVVNFEAKDPKGSNLTTCEWGRTLTYDLQPTRTVDNLKRIGDVASLSGSGYHPCAGLTDEELLQVLATSDSASEVHDAMNALNKVSGQEERLRLFYVALTRAKEMLILCLPSSETKGKPFGTLKPIASLVELALAGPEGFDGLEGTYDFKGTAPARMTGEFCRPLNQEQPPVTSAKQGEPKTFAVLEQGGQGACLNEVPFQPLADTVFSYSSLSGYSPADALGATGQGIMDGCSAAHQLADGLDDMEPSNMTPEGPELQEDFRNALGDALLLAQEDDEVQFARRVPSDPEKSTDFGNAFHQLAQTMVLLRKRETDNLAMPDDQAIANACRRGRLKPHQQERLADALNRWASSSLARSMAKLPNLQAEVPFFLQLPAQSDEQPLFLEGEIDLMANGTFQNPVDSTAATLVDYKTGGYADETHQELALKHALQAQCYAYALLRSGYQEVHAHFVRVEQQDRHGEPQVVSYAFTCDDLATIESDLTAAIEHAGSL